MANNATTESTCSARRWSWQNGLLYVGLPLGVMLAAAWLFCDIFHRAPITTDENSYVFQAYNFLAGKIARPAPVFSSIFYHEMIILDDEVGWLSRYPPGHPLWLLPGCLLGLPHLMIMLAAGLSVALMARTGALFGRREAWLAALLLALSPFFLFTHGTLLSHTSGLLATLLLLHGFLRWQMTGANRWAALAGLGWSWLLLNRTYTAFWIALPFGVYALVRLVQRRREKSCWQGTAAFAGVAMLGVAALLLYNYLSTGHALTMTFMYYDPTEKPGFGLRHASGKAGIHTFVIGLGFLVDNVTNLNRWLLGFKGSLAVVTALTLLGWRSAWTPLLISAPLLVWAGYIGFYYPGPHETGPGYFLETVPFLILGAALGGARLLAWLGARPRWAQGLALLALLLGLAVNGRFMVRQGVQLSAYNRVIGELRACLQQAPRDALVIATDATPFTGRNHGLLIFNPQGTDSQPLVARTLGETDPLLCRLYSNRKPYVLVTTNGPPRLAPFNFKSFVYDFACACDKAGTRTGQRQLASNGRDIHIAASGGRDAEGWLAFGVVYPVYPGRFVAEFDLAISKALPTQKIVTPNVAVDNGRRMLAERTLTGPPSNEKTALPFETDRFGYVELRVYYLGAGDVVLRGFRVRDVGGYAASANPSPAGDAPADAGK